VRISKVNNLSLEQAAFDSMTDLYANDVGDSVAALMQGNSMEALAGFDVSESELRDRILAFAFAEPKRPDHRPRLRLVK
jgi:hypothetical protein